MKRLKDIYREDVVKKLIEKHGYKNPMLVPRLVKIVISMGVAEATKDRNAIQDAMREMTVLSGQKPIVTLSKKAISNFKLREGQAIGLKVTLRNKRMYDFLERFCHIITPRIKDFRGFAKKFDGRGNYSLGLEDQQIFPEINLDQVKRTQGMNITFVTTACSDDECYSLIRGLGFPFKE
jgi:large subunit ribosomal protein L5